MKADEIKLDGAACELRHYDSVREMIEYGYRHVPNDILSRADFSGREFHGSEAELLEAATETWQEGLRLLDKARAAVSSHELPRPVSRRRKRRIDEFDGQEVNYDRLRSGQTFWESAVRQRTTGPAVVTIAVDVCTACRYKAKDIVWRGLAALIVSEILEAAGYRVELIAYAYSRDMYTDGASNVVTCTLKEAGQPMDAAALIAATSGWFYRCIVFGCDNRSHAGRQATSFLGRPTRVTAKHFAALGLSPSLVIENLYDEFAAIDTIEKTIAAVQSGEVVIAA